MGRSTVWKDFEVEIGIWYSHHREHKRNPLSGRNGLMPGDVPTPHFVIEAKFRERQPMLYKFHEYVQVDNVILPIMDEDLCAVYFMPAMAALHQDEIREALTMSGRIGYMGFSFENAVARGSRVRMHPHEVPLALDKETRTWWDDTVKDAARSGPDIQPLLFIREKGDRESVLTFLRKSYCAKLMKRLAIRKA